MQIINFLQDNQDLIEQAATLLVEGFREDWPDAWPDMAAALETVNEAFAPERISRAAVDEAGTVLGWIGGIPEYDGLVWELHPLVVRTDRRGQGIGKALVLDLEALVRAKGGLTLMLGSDDENNMTSLGGIDLYPDPLEHLRNIRNLKGHPFEFYQKLGFSLTGVVPDANGPGQPDILMAKSLR